MPHSSRVTLFRRGKFWYLNYWLDGNRVKEPTGLTSKTEAELIRADREKSLVLGQLHHLRQDISVSRRYREYLRFGIANYKTEKTQTTDRSVLKKFFRWAAVKTIDQLTTAEVMDYFAYRVKVDKLVQSSLRRNREAIHAFFNWAKRKGYIGENPVTEVKPPRLPDHEIRFLKLGEIEGCLKAVAGDLIEPVIACAILAGLRREELCWLAWEDVDLDEKKPLLRIRSKTEGERDWKPKTKRHRLVPVCRRLYPYLVALRIKRGDCPWVFPSPEGCRWDPDNLGHRREELMDRLGLPWTFLDFRHTYGSQLAMKGVSIYKIAKLMGNSVRIAERHYAALQTEDLHEDVDFAGLPQAEAPSAPRKGKKRRRGEEA